MPFGLVVGRAVHQVAVEHQQVADVHQGGFGFRHVMVDDFEVAVIGARPTVRLVAMDRLDVRTG